MKFLQALKTKWLALPRWQLWCTAALAVFALVYLAWCKWGTPPVKPGQTVDAVTSPKVADMERKPVAPAKLMVFTPKAEAVKRLKLPPQEAANEDEEVFEATDAPPTRYGTQTVTFVNMSTGTPRSVVTAKTAPWFRFERGNTAGVECGLGPKGRYFQGDYQRDICSIRGVILAARVSVTSYPTETDWRAGARVEYRW